MEALEGIADDKVVYWFTQFWSWLAVALIVSTGGVAAKRVALALVPVTTPDDKKPKWFKIWQTTIRWHPVFVGSLMGVVPGLPAAEWVPDNFMARAVWFGMAGAMSGQIYAALKDLPTVLKLFVSKKLGVTSPSSSEPPEPPSGESEIKP
jgi:hypothetical protein